MADTTALLEQLGITKKDSFLHNYIDKKNMSIAVFVGTIIFFLEMIVLAVEFSLTKQVNKFFVMRWISRHLPIFIPVSFTYIGTAIAAAVYLKKSCKNHAISLVIIYFQICVTSLFAFSITYSSCVYGKFFFDLVLTIYMLFTLYILNPLTVIFFLSAALATFLYFINANPDTRHLLTPQNMIYIGTEHLAVLIVSILRHATSIRWSRAESKLQQTNIDLQRISFYDALTGLKNRYALRADYDSYIGRDVIVIMTDIDDFKFFNDTYGHDVGDLIIKSVADHIRNDFTEKYSYRLGGDEFLIISTGIPIEVFESQLSRKNKELNKVTVKGKDIYSSNSAGYIYGYVQTEDMLREMIQLSDTQLYEAKNRGKNCAIGLSYTDAKERINTESVFTIKAKNKSGLDMLTSLPNMMTFRNKALLILNNTNLQESPMSVVYFDVDMFKLFNEKYDFQRGDQLLKSLAEILEFNFPEQLVSRFADDHFVVLCKSEKLEHTLEKVQLDFYSVWSNRLKAGIYNYTDKETDISIACDRARIACDSIKNQYAIDYRYYDEKLNENHLMEQYIIDHFEDALQGNWIYVYFQPIVRTATYNICDFEALSRWEDPVYGHLEPSVFIPILEKARIIYKLDLYIIRHICTAYHYHLRRKLPLIPISVNISRVDFDICDIVGLIKTEFNHYDLPISMLSIEITESAFVENTNVLKENITKLRNAGFQVWMDDFGSGYSSLNTLEDFGFDVIKIDMNFLKRFNTSPKIQPLVTHIVSMAKELGIKTLAEGVETTEHLEFLNRIGCEKAQGYLFSKPLTLVEVTNMLEKKTLPVEPEDERSYYDSIGAVNILNANNIERNTNIPVFSEGVASAIIEVNKKIIRYVTANVAYMNFLASLNISSLQTSEEMINNPERENNKIFLKGAENCRKSKKCEVIKYKTNGRDCIVRMFYIATNCVTMADAIVIVALNNSDFSKC